MNVDFYSDIRDLAPGIFINGSIGFCAGYVLGAVTQSNPLLAAQVVMIASIANYLFCRGARIIFEYPLDRRILYFAKDLLGGISLVDYLAKREIIGKIGSLALFGVVAVASVINTILLIREE